MAGALIAAAAWLVLACSVAPADREALPRSLQVRPLESKAVPGELPRLRIATLNIAHGRGDSMNQLLVSADGSRANLDAIGRFLREQSIQIAALQEVDSPSWWSGGMDHAEYIARGAGYPNWVQADHASLGLGNYGTAILSSLPLRSALALDFAPSPPTATKGFTLAEIAWTANERQTITLDVISIHMDFSRDSVRRAQLNELEQVVARRRNPLIIMGDFNSEELADQLTAQSRQGQRRLHTVPLEPGAHHSYKDKRLDWIIVSEELAIVDYQTAPDILSDHRAVVATLELQREDVE